MNRAFIGTGKPLFLCFLSWTGTLMMQNVQVNWPYFNEVLYQYRAKLTQDLDQYTFELKGV